MLERVKAVFCALFGHSRIQTHCWGYWYCGRCGVLVGDSLAGVYRAEGVVIVGHGCDQCRDNYRRLSWRDKILAPKPF